jgi:hypothetical protein
MFRSPRNGSSALFSNFLFEGCISGASMNIERLRGFGDDPVELVGSDQGAFSFVPYGEDFGRGLKGVVLLILYCLERLGGGEQGVSGVSEI